MEDFLILMICLRVAIQVEGILALFKMVLAQNCPFVLIRTKFSVLIILQISVSPNEVDDETKLLISTEAKTIICDSVRQSFVEVGSEPR